MRHSTDAVPPRDSLQNHRLCGSTRDSSISSEEEFRLYIKKRAYAFENPSNPMSLPFKDSPFLIQLDDAVATS